MKREYLQSLPKPTDFKNQAYKAYLSQAQQLFAQLQQKYDKETAERLNEQLKSLSDIRQIKKVHKKPIYEHFLKIELQSLQYIKGSYSVPYAIMKTTKCIIQDFKIDWKQFFERVQREAPQISGSSNSKNLEIFLKHIKCFFDENNAIEVLNYLEQNNFKDIYKTLTLFVKITPQTNQEIFNKYIKMLIDRCKLQKISKTDFLSLFVALQKSRKHISLSKQVYQFVNDLVLQYILASDKSSKKNTFENNFNSSSAETLQKNLGKANPDSIKLLQIIFSFVKKFVKPLQNSSKSLMFIYWLFKSIFLRVQLEKRTRQRLQKLIQKIEKKKSAQQEEQEAEPETKSQTQIAINEKKQLEEGEKKQKDDPEEDEDQEDMDDEDQENQDQDMQQLLIFGQAGKVNFENDDEDKGDTDQEKKEKMEKLLSNQLTPQILACIQRQVQQLFDVLYFVNSRKTICHLLRYIYRLFPKFAVKSLDTLNIAANISNINEEGLVRNLTVTVEHMFMPENYKDGVKNLMRVLEKAFNSRRIIDVWGIYESVSSKIPLLDEKDLEKIDDKDKQLFQKTFQMNHDRFYDQYSGHMLEAFKKLLSEAEFMEKDQNNHYILALEQYYYNSYPYMKKRLLEEVMQVLTEKPNFLAFQYLVIADYSNKQYEILKQQFISMNQQNRDTQQIRLQFLKVLSKKMKLQQLKPYARKMAHRGHFNIIFQYYSNKAPEGIKWNPYKTTLNYFYEDPKLTIQFQTTVEERRKILKQLQKYRDQLLDQASQEIDKMKQDQSCTVQKRVIKSYTTPAKISTQSQRKKLHQILLIVASINLMMEQKFIDIKNKKKLQLVASEVAPYGFLNPQKPFNKQIKKLINIQEVLHDPKLISVLNKLLTNEYFLYFDYYEADSKNLQKEKKKNKNHESPDCSNRIIYSNEYLYNARAYQDLLLHKTNAGKNYKIDSLIQELFILSMINANQTYKDIRSMFQLSSKIDQYRGFLFDVMKPKIQNRDLIKRISSTFDYLVKTQQYRPFTDQQVLDYVDYHATLIQAHDVKIKELAFKSFRKFNKIIEQNPISNFVSEQMFLKYRNNDKLQLIWLIYAAAEMTHLQFENDKKVVEDRVRVLLKQTQGLLLHQTRSTRRISLFLYPFLIRTLKKLNATYEKKTYQTEKYTQKSLEEFIQSGFIRKQQEKIDLKDKSVHKKHPQPEYRIKSSSQKQQNFFSFLIENPQNSLKFIKSYHSDLASTAEMLLSAMQSSISNVDLFSIATKSIQKLIYIYKTSNLTVSTSQFLVGSRFFKYLCMEDSRSGFRFFKTIKDFILNCLDNLQSLDNQTLVILYSYNLMSVYESTYKQKNAQIQQFLTRIITQIIKKSSKNIYTKLQTIFFKKIKNYDAIKFINELCEKMLEENKKIYRAGYLLAVVSGKTYASSERLLRKMLDQRAELENQSYFSGILNYLTAFPMASVWKKDQILKTQVINLQQLKSEDKVKYFLDDYVIYNNKQLLNYFVKEIKQMIFSQQIDLIKAGFNILNSLIKNCASLYPDEQMSEFLAELLRISMNLLKEKKQLQLDFDSSYKAIGYLFGSQILPPQVFQKYLTIVLENVEPTKKSIDVLTEILNSPINYIKLNDEIADRFISKILDMQANPALYKSLLKILSTFFRYKVYSFDKINGREKENKNRRILLIQSYLLAENITLDPEIVREALKLSTKDKKNMWAREMLLIRGRREYFDDEKTYEVWREIKQLSYTYHYHA